MYEGVGLRCLVEIVRKSYNDKLVRGWEMEQVGERCLRQICSARTGEQRYRHRCCGKN